MYEAFFGLRSRPFSPLPRVDSYIPLAPVREPLESLVRCLTQEQGIGVLTAPPGAGKSLVCRLLQQRFAPVRRTVLLTTARFPTRRALLQAILFELKHPFVGLSEQESRLRVLDLLQASPAPQNRMLLIVDEAHLLSPRGLEELRTLTDYEIAGKPCVSLILSGQLELEELLTQPDMNALNQRVGCHVCIEPLTFEESSQYLRERLRFAGNDGLTIFTPEAIQLIGSASEGNPRRLSQLADHSLLLAYAEEERPVSESIVRDALLDLRELPLHWNAPLDLTREMARNPLEEFAESYEAEESACDDESLAEGDTDIDLREDSAFEVGDSASETAELFESAASVFEVGGPLDESPIDQLCQVTKLIVPGEAFDAVDTLMWPTAQEATPPTESHAFETASSEVETFYTDELETELGDETLSMETLPGRAFESGDELVFSTEPLISPAMKASVCPSGFEELVVDDAYARIDQQLESSVRVLPPQRVTSWFPASAASPAALTISAHAPSLEVEVGEVAQVSHDSSCESAADFDVIAIKSQHVLLESQLLDFINEISVDVHQIRLEREASRTAADQAEGWPPVNPEAPRHQSLRESLRWHFDVVEPEADTDWLAPAAGERSHESSIESPSDTPKAVAAPRDSTPIPVVAHATESPREPTALEERRYGQLFTRLQRQRRRVETVMNRERYSGTEARQS